LPVETIAERAARVTSISYPAADRVTVRTMTDVRMMDSGESLRNEQTAVKALTLAGARQVKVLRFDYDPASSDISIKSVRILKAAGEVLDVDLAGVRDLPAPKHMIYWTMRVKILDLPPIEPGDVVVWETEFRGFQIAYLEEGDERFIPPQRGEFYDVVLFGGEYPIAEQVYRLTVPRDKKVQLSSYNGNLSSRVETSKDQSRYVFRLDDIPAFPLETNALAHSDSVPKVVIATLEGWPDKSRWFFLTNEPSFMTTPEIDAKVQQIIAGRKTPEERATALNRWVARYIRYSGLSMGKGEGYTLHPAAMTYRERAGVCKDKAGMLVAMMRSAGFTDTFAAMTMAGARVEDVPAEQFNHCVVAWRRPDGGFLLLDPTWAPLSRDDWSRAEAQQHYVIGTAAGEQLRVTPRLDPPDNTLDVTIETRIAADGAVRSDVKVAAHGYLEDALRRWFANRPEDEWPAIFDGMARRTWPWAQVTSSDVSAERVHDLDRAFETSFGLAAENAIQGVSSHAFALTPAAFSLLVNDGRTGENVLAERVDSRRRGLSFRCPKRITYTETIRLPYPAGISGWKDVVVENRLGRIEATVRASGETVTVKLSMSFSERFVPVEDLAKYQALLDASGAGRLAPLFLQEVEK